MRAISDPNELKILTSLKQKALFRVSIDISCRASI